jgi:hypothetical protein
VSQCHTEGGSGGVRGPLGGLWVPCGGLGALRGPGGACGDLWGVRAFWGLVGAALCSPMSSEVTNPVEAGFYRVLTQSEVWILIHF